DKTGYPIFDDFGDGSSVERDHRRAAGHCVDQYQPKRFGPGDRRQQRDGTAEIARFFTVADLADILDVAGCQQLADFGFEVVAVDSVDLGCNLQRYPTALGYPDRLINGVLRRNAPEKGNGGRLHRLWCQKVLRLAMVTGAD